MWRELSCRSSCPPASCQRLPGQHWDAQPQFPLFSHSQRSTVSRDTRGTLRLQDEKRRCSFLLAPGSCQCFSSNDLSPLHEQLSSISRWLWFAAVLKPLVRGVPRSPGAHSKMPALAGQPPSSGTEPQLWRQHPGPGLAALPPRFLI